ncbi:hypothetical protein BDN72DRAFT_904534 [Pluteus cervinus]|uniref:Uncharacterized protein n=1 Tax=Pluteus cervinus TaxID=181527 RepID=A0ACD3A5G4_9AGAR|nr:hypothetical protein BDN72DRAFT_904534 [Pluteus cervinus]
MFNAIENEWERQRDTIQPGHLEEVMKRTCYHTHEECFSRHPYLANYTFTPLRNVGEFHWGFKRKRSDNVLDATNGRLRYKVTIRLRELLRWKIIRIKGELHDHLQRLLEQMELGGGRLQDPRYLGEWLSDIRSAQKSLRYYEVKLEDSAYWQIIFYDKELLRL